MVTPFAQSARSEKRWLQLVCSLSKSFIIPLEWELHLPWCCFSFPPSLLSSKNCGLGYSGAVSYYHLSLPPTTQVLHASKTPYYLHAIPASSIAYERKENGNSKIKEKRTLWTERDSRDTVMNIRTICSPCLHSKLQVLEINRQAFMLKFFCIPRQPISHLGQVISNLLNSIVIRKVNSRKKISEIY